MIEAQGVVWALSALALGQITVMAAFALITFVFMLVTWPILFFFKAVFNLIVGWRI